VLGLPAVCLDLGLVATTAAALPAGGLAVAIVFNEALLTLAPLLLPLAGVALGGRDIGAARGRGGGGGGAGTAAAAGLGAVAGRGEPGFVALAPVCRQKAKGTWQIIAGRLGRVLTTGVRVGLANSELRWLGQLMPTLVQHAAPDATPPRTLLLLAAVASGWRDIVTLLGLGGRGRCGGRGGGRSRAGGGGSCR
jgi:hypothetical protein